MQATAVTHTAAVTPATSNSKVEIKSMTATTAGMQTMAGMKATEGPSKQ